MTNEHYETEMQETNDTYSYFMMVRVMQAIYCENGQIGNDLNSTYTHNY